MKQLDKNNNFEFYVTSEFQAKFLQPLIKNLYAKTEAWDDYNEVFHCTEMIHIIEEKKSATIDYHVIMGGEICVGILLISREIKDIEGYFLYDKFTLEDMNKMIFIHYFHIAKEGRGHGTRWLEEVVFSHYRNLGKTTAYVKSTHSKAFSLYQRLGEEIGEYTKKSDNNLYMRRGKIFKIML